MICREYTPQDIPEKYKGTTFTMIHAGPYAKRGMMSVDNKRDRAYEAFLQSKNGTILVLFPNVNNEFNELLYAFLDTKRDIIEEVVRSRKLIRLRTITINLEDVLAREA